MVERVNEFLFGEATIHYFSAAFGGNLFLSTFICP